MKGEQGEVDLEDTKEVMSPSCLNIFNLSSSQLAVAPTVPPTAPGAQWTGLEQTMDVDGVRVTVGGAEVDAVQKKFMENQHLMFLISI